MRTAALFAWLLIALAALTGYARAQGHDQYHEFYKGLTNGNGQSCCNGHDCHQAVSRPSPTGPGWQALIGGAWCDIPIGAVLRRSGPDGGSHVCHSTPAPGQCPISIYCFIPEIQT